MFTTLPRGISLIFSVIKEFIEKKYTEAENYYRAMRLTLSISYLLIHLNIALKVDGRVDWKWSTVFWPFWILSALYFGACFMSIIALFWKLCPALFNCFKGDWKEIRVTFWFALNIIGFCFFSVIVFYQLERSLEDGILYKGLVMVFFYIGISSIIVVIFTFLIKNDIIDIFWHIRISYLKEVDEEEQRRISLGRGRGRVVPLGVESRENQENRKKEKKRQVKKLAIPKYLVQLGGAFFARATPQDIFMEKMEKQKKKIEQKKKMKSLTVKSKIRENGEKKSSVIKSLNKKKGNFEEQDDAVIMIGGSHRSKGNFKTERTNQKKGNLTEEENRKKVKFYL